MSGNGPSNDEGAVPPPPQVEVTKESTLSNNLKVLDKGLNLNLTLGLAFGAIMKQMQKAQLNNEGFTAEDFLTILKAQVADMPLNEEDKEKVIAAVVEASPFLQKKLKELADDSHDSIAMYDVDMLSEKESQMLVEEGEQVEAPVLLGGGASLMGQPNPKARLDADTNGGKLKASINDMKQEKPSVRAIDSVRPGMRHLNEKQYGIYKDKFLSGGGFEHALSDALKAADKKLIGGFDNVTKVADFAYQGAKQRLLEVKAQRDNPDIDSPSDSVVLEAEQQYKLASQARDTIQLLGSIKHANTKYSDKAVQSQLNKLGRDNKTGDLHDTIENIITSKESSLHKLTNKKTKYDDKAIDKEVGLFQKRRILKDKHTDFNIKVERNGQDVSATFFFDAGLLSGVDTKAGKYDLGKGGVSEVVRDKAIASLRHKAYKSLQHQVHDFMEVAIANGKGNPDNPIDIILHDPKCFELATQAIIDLKTRAIEDGREFTMTIPAELRGKDPFIGEEFENGTFQLKGGEMTPQEAALFNHFATQKSENKAGMKAPTCAGANVLNQIKGVAYNPEQSPAHNLAASLNSYANRQNQKFESKMDDAASIVKQVESKSELKSTTRAKKS